MVPSEGDVTTNNEKKRKARKVTAGLVGAGLGGLLGAYTKTPDLAALGAMAGYALPEIVEAIQDFANRQLSSWEEQRVAAAARFAIERILKRQERGHQLRNDGFFIKPKHERSPANQIFEGVLLKSKSEHEDKKVKLLGNFFANIAFMPEISPPEANHLLKVADGLTYRQLCLLALFHTKERSKRLKLRDSEDYYPSSTPHPTQSLLQEIIDMCGQGILNLHAPDGSVINSITYWADVVPERIIPSDLGSQLALLLDVNTKSNNDIKMIIDQLQ
jgi:hypothetical protein